MILTPSSPTCRRLAALVVAAGLALPLVAMAQTGTPAAPDDPPENPTAFRIEYLHDRLRVTKAQEPAWEKIARALRDNARATAPLLRERLRAANEGSATDLVAAQQRLTEAQGAALGRFLEAFRPFYASLSDNQKKIADAVLRQGRLETMIAGIPPALVPPRSSAAPYQPMFNPPPASGSAVPVYPATPTYPIFTPTYPPAIAPVAPLNRPWIGGEPGLLAPPVILPPIGRFDHPHHLHEPGEMRH